MKALPAPKTSQIIDRINTLQMASPYFLDPNSLSDQCRELRLIRREIDALFNVDARAAWEVQGAWYALVGNWDETEKAFNASMKLGDSGTNFLNWGVNCVNLGMFSAAHEAYRVIGAPEMNHFTDAIRLGFGCGAIGQVARFAERAEEMKIPWNEGDRETVMNAHKILAQAGITDERIARHLDVAGTVLRRHHIRNQAHPRVTVADGLFNGVTYVFSVPVSANEAFDLNMELAAEEYAAGIEKDVAFDVVFEGTPA